MIYFTRCYAKDIPARNGNKEHQTQYFLEDNHSKITCEVITRGLLRSLEDIAESKYMEWKNSFFPPNFLKQKDYETTVDALKKFGTNIGQFWLKSKNKPNQIYNSNPATTNNGFRKLKPFEESALLEGIISATNYTHLKSQQ
ncbi:MAG: hypothetical protein ACP5OA_06695 [Candidatus Woesearchaeota archaeon]